MMTSKRNSRGSELKDSVAKRSHSANHTAGCLGRFLLGELHGALGRRGEVDELPSLTPEQWRSVASASALMVAFRSGDFARVTKGEIPDEAMRSLIALAKADMASMEPTSNGLDREYALEQYDHRLAFLPKLTDSQLGSEEVYEVLSQAISLDPHKYFACVPWREPFRHPRFDDLAELTAKVHPMSWEAIPHRLRTADHMCAAASAHPEQLGSMDVPKGRYNWRVVEAAIRTDMARALGGLEAEHRRCVYNSHSEMFANHPAKVIHAMPPEWREASESTGKPDAEEADRRMKEALLANPEANLRWVCEERLDLLDSEVRAAFLCTHWDVLSACFSECGKCYPEEWWVGLIWGGPENTYHQHGYGINAVVGRCTGQQVIDYARQLGFDTTDAELSLNH